jgi:glycosyltransferase involved in cell wall biosynthesis
MKDTEFDLVILNNCPSFYKINLYNEISKSKKIFVIFIGLTKEVVIHKNFQKTCNFPFILINNSDVDKRRKIYTFYKIYQLLAKLTFKKIIFGGYTMPELILLSFIFPKNKNILQTESAAESKLSGWKYFVKSKIINRFSTALVSGKIHKDVLIKIGFKGEITITKGVGLIKKDTTQSISKISGSKLRYLYVGRLIKLKNIEFLIKIFNKLDAPLSIVGIGQDEEYLKSIAAANISFFGFIDNNDIQGIYQNHDVFILPSLSEPWGLVVEEALQGKCVLLLSNKVGSYPELLEEPRTGEVFDPYSENNFLEALHKIEKKYFFYEKNVNTFNLESKDCDQVNAYLDIFKTKS